MTRREKLIEFVIIQHGTQVRKYTGEPYVVHLLAVARTAEEVTGVMFGFEIGLCHDLIEDVKDFTYEKLHSFLLSIDYNLTESFFICDGVEELTDVFTAEAYPDMNRKSRKEAEAKRQGTISPNSQSIKYCDLINNTESIVEHDLGFAQVYLEEKGSILKYMIGGNKEKFDECVELLNLSKVKVEEGLLQLSLLKLNKKEEEPTNILEVVGQFLSLKKEYKVIEEFTRVCFKDRFLTIHSKEGPFYSSFQVLSKIQIKVYYYYYRESLKYMDYFIISLEETKEKV